MSPRGSAILSLSVGFVVSVFVGSGFLLSLVRDELHFQCSFFQMGSDDPGSFYCADGISYIGVGVGTFGAYGVILLVALGIASAGRTTAGMLQSRLMVGISILPIAMFSWSTWYATSARSYDQTPGVNYWVQPLLPVTVVLVTAVIVILAAGLIPRPGVRTAGLRVAMAFFVMAVFIQPGSLSAVAVALGVLAAAMFLASGATGDRKPPGHFRQEEPLGHNPRHPTSQAFGNARQSTPGNLSPETARPRNRTLATQQYEWMSWWGGRLTTLSPRRGVVLSWILRAIRNEHPNCAPRGRRAHCAAWRN